MNTKRQANLKSALKNETPERPPAPRQKRPYTPPELTEHGSAQDVTLQTFFGSFSPTQP